MFPAQREEQLNRAFSRLEEDRTFATCHVLKGPIRHFHHNNDNDADNSLSNDVIVIGGGTVTFYDRQRLDEFVKLRKNEPLYRNIARFIDKLEPDERTYAVLLR